MQACRKIIEEPSRPAHPLDGRDLLAIPESERTFHFASPDLPRQKKLAQFLTPPHVAELMADQFAMRRKIIRLLDPGAGLGILSAAFVRRQLMRPKPPQRIDLTLFEIDSALLPGLKKTVEACHAACRDSGVEFISSIQNEDFIAYGARILSNELFASDKPRFDSVIVNPPYGKLSTNSISYRLLKDVAAETTNLYAAFLNLAIGLLDDNGEIVAITPRSYCNGPYFKPFRQNLLKKATILGIHAFDSRTAAFKHDRILQETVILHVVKRPKASATIRISQSPGEPGETVISHLFPGEEIVSSKDSEAFIHIPLMSQHGSVRRRLAKLESTLTGLRLQVSTGRVVDFRAREFLAPDPLPGTAPLVYPCHFSGLFVNWPKENARKPNAILDSDKTRSLLVPSGVYVLLKRFTSKEERRRVVACIFDPARVRGKWIGFENHLNYIHNGGKSLDMPLAKGLWAYLNSSILDAYFRQFNGHTQVNATDLRNIPFPSAVRLRAMGERVGESALIQDEIDTIMEAELEP
jgi:adenine-specific DNA-methyltransferase